MRPESFRTPLTLTGRFIELVPLEEAHRDPLRAAAHNPDAYRYLRGGPGETTEDLARLIEFQLARRASGTDLPFTVRTLPGRTAVGMTRYLRIDRDDDSLEIGGTWLDTSVWRTPVNTESKLLLMRHAFEDEGAHRIQFQTDLRNERSQHAIARLGATREGVLRDDIRLPDGHFRSSVYYSVIASEWPAVKRRLETYLSRPWTPANGPGPA